MRPEPRAVVRSTLPEAEAVLSAVMRTRLPGAVRSEVRARSAGASARATAPVRRMVHRAEREPVDGDADTGDARSAAATSRGDARCRRSRRGRARRGLRRAQRAAGQAERAATEGSGGVRDCSGNRSEAEIGTESPAAKRDAQILRTGTGTIDRHGHRHHQHHGRRRHPHHRRDHRRRDRHRHHRRRHRSASSKLGGRGDVVDTAVHTGEVTGENTAAGTRCTR